MTRSRDAEKTQAARPWHTLDLASLLELHRATERGLTQDEAAARLSRFGPNRLPERPPPALWQVVARQFYSPLIYILLIAAVVSALTGDFKDAGFIAAVLVLNAVIGSYQEWRAERSSHALRRLLQVRATVQRAGEAREVLADEVVPGDVVWLESGNRVPADVRLLSAHGLEVDESLLTGESLPVAKDPIWQGDERAPVGDRANMLFAGSTTTRGRCKGLVVATGSATHVGQLALDLTSGGGKPPLIERMERFTNVIAAATLVVACTIGVLGATLGTYTVSEMFLFVIALAVSAIPEGLPVAMTVALSIATTRMARRGVIVRRLSAVEGLGSCTLIATDKTGTLTLNELTVGEVVLADGETFSVTGEGFVPDGEVLSGGRPVEDRPALYALARAGVLCNEADLHRREDEWAWRGDAVDVALLSLGHKLGCERADALDSHPQVNEIPFESEHQFAATFHGCPGGDAGVRVFVKGAPERVIAMCHDRLDEAALEGIALSLARRGFRVLALAEGDGAAGALESEAPPQPSGLSFLGFVGMIDPLRPGARDAVRACHEAGVGVCMVTGDHAVTALAIARDLDLASEEHEVITGPQLAARAPEELVQLVQGVRVFARVAPHQKLEIVAAAEEAGNFVAVTGDGVNDAPALRAANIGVAMGKAGTDVARDAAELVVSDDDFATIIAGIEEGRIAYDNIRKVIYLLVSTGAAELVLMGLAIGTGTPLPLLPVQILWLNLVTNGIQDVALAFEPGEDDVLARRPRSPREPIFNRLMLERTLVAAVVVGVLGFGVFRWMCVQGWEVTEARNVLLLMMVLFENFHIGNCRSETKSAFKLSPFRSPVLLAGAALALRRPSRRDAPAVHAGVARHGSGDDRHLAGRRSVGREHRAGHGAAQVVLVTAQRWCMTRTWRDRVSFPGPTSGRGPPAAKAYGSELGRLFTWDAS